MLVRDRHSHAAFCLVIGLPGWSNPIVTGHVENPFHETRKPSASLVLKHRKLTIGFINTGIFFLLKRTRVAPCVRHRQARARPALTREKVTRQVRHPRDPPVLRSPPSFVPAAAASRRACGRERAARQRRGTKGPASLRPALGVAVPAGRAPSRDATRRGVSRAAGFVEAIEAIPRA